MPASSSEGASLVTTAPVLWQQGAFLLITSIPCIPGHEPCRSAAEVEKRSSEIKDQLQYGVQPGLITVRTRVRIDL